MSTKKSAPKTVKPTKQELNFHDIDWRLVFDATLHSTTFGVQEEAAKAMNAYFKVARKLAEKECQ